MSVDDEPRKDTPLASGGASAPHSEPSHFSTGHLYISEKVHTPGDRAIALVIKKGSSETSWAHYFLWLSKKKAEGFPKSGPPPHWQHLGSYRSRILKIEKRRHSEAGKTLEDTLQDLLRGNVEPSRVRGWNSLAERTLYTSIWHDWTASRRVVLPEGYEFHPIVSNHPSARDVWYIAGQSGAGKSHIMRKLAESYHHFFKDRKIYLLSALAEDETLDSLTPAQGKPTRLDIRKLIEKPPVVSNVTDTLTLMDDFDTFMGDKESAVLQLIDVIGTQGRHKQASMACATHRITNYNKTRVVLGEATHFVVFPQVTSHNKLRALLGNYGSLSDVEVSSLYGMESRWVVAVQGTPSVLYGEREARILFREE